MISADKLTVTFTGFGIPTAPGETNPTMIKHAVFQAMKDDLNESDGVNDYANTVDVFVEHADTTYQEAAKRMAELADEIVQLSRIAWSFEPGVELLTAQIRTLLKEVDAPFKA